MKNHVLSSTCQAVTAGENMRQVKRVIKNKKCEKVSSVAFRKTVKKDLAIKNSITLRLIT